MSDEPDYWQLKRIIQAYDSIAHCGISEEEARLRHEEYWQVERWLSAERVWQASIKNWLTAEGKWIAGQRLLRSDAYIAGKRGWERVREYAPNLDGVDTFERLPDSLQFRYAAFAAAVLDLNMPEEIKSTKQLTAVTASAESRHSCDID